MKILNPSAFSGPGDEPGNDKALVIARKYQEIAEEIFSLAKAQIIVKMRFLDRALFELKPLANSDYQLATDGRHLIYDPAYLLRGYRQSQSFALRAMTHMLMHNLFRHMFIQYNINQELWDLSCDLAAESMIRELQIRQLQDAPGQEERNRVLDKLSENVRTITSEKLMRYFQQNPLDITEIQRLRNLFSVDEHILWYLKSDPEPDPESVSDTQRHLAPSSEIHPLNQTSEMKNNIIDHKNESKNEINDEILNTSEDENESQSEDGYGSDDKEHNKDHTMDNDSNSSDGTGDKPVTSSGNIDAFMNTNIGGTFSQCRIDIEESQIRELEEMWRVISEHVLTDLETFAKQQGFEAGGMEQALRSLNRERYDYTSFLRKFATMHEVMRLSPDEYDFVYYTYGLTLYKDMPLVEPLEYREDKRIRDFVIAIDTSGSVKGTLVQLFLQKTYTILKQEETFGHRFNLHIIQCDTEIQEDKVIRSQHDFDQYLKTMKLHGFGGTDFRPVFEYVEQLRAARAFTNLKGLLYFTDGYGIYPKKQTDYQTAFVFLDIDETGQHFVPPWAIRIILETDSLEA